MKIRSVLSLGLTLALVFTAQLSLAQDKLKKMPGYEQYRAVAPQIRGSVDYGRLRVNWSDDSKSFNYMKDGKEYQFDVKKKQATLLGEMPPPPPGHKRGCQSCDRPVALCPLQRGGAARRRRRGRRRGHCGSGGWPGQLGRRRQAP